MAESEFPPTSFGNDLEPESAKGTTPEVTDRAVDHSVISNESNAKDYGVLPADEARALQDLMENVRDQDDLERDITKQASLVMIEQEDERDRKRIERVNSNLEKLYTQKRILQNRLNNQTSLPSARAQTILQLEKVDAAILGLRSDIVDIQSRIDKRHETEGADTESQAHGNSRLANESQRDFLIRTGKITPFSRLTARESTGIDEDLGEVLRDAEEELDIPKAQDGGEAEPRSHQNLRLPGFAGAEDSTFSIPADEFSLRPRKKRRTDDGVVSSTRGTMKQPAADAYEPSSSEEGAIYEDDEDDEDDLIMTSSTSKKRPPRKSKAEEIVELATIDDGNEKMYQARLKNWVDKRSAARELADEHLEHPEDEEWFQPCPGIPDHQFDNGIKLPGDIFPALFDYQKTGVQWLGELFTQSVGGIIGDEMGLGKTIQIISFLAGLHYSKKLTKPIIVIAPATVLRQWVNEFHKWWPPLRVSILHSSGSGMMNLGRESRMDDVEEMYGRAEQQKPPKSHKAAKKIVDRVVAQGHVLVTTYAGLQSYSDVLIPVEWDYAVLDEGHKIRNPNTAITIHCKELRTANRVILSGTPMQNNLIELWSLFDFVFPMRLGTLVSFRQAFEVPIKIGGYASATNFQVLTATKCAETLKAAISPYLLQRLKVDVAADLPKKSEQVLFCKLTKPQREAYEAFLNSDELTSILTGKRQSLYGIDILRKICNHPDLLDPRLNGKPGYKWGNPNKSGKMQVVKALLDMWKGYGHKTLLFSQGVQMLDVIEEFVKSLDGFNYIRMDGKTHVKDRQTLVDRFNNDPDLHVFLLTTKVGGLGVNLTGANRVIIFDPDWNPSTDIQARERAWRLGQKKEVTIYRLMTAGTIEEKIYHRQIFKQFLTNKILKDPKQRQTFQMKDLHDLFTLGSTDDGTTETGEMFRGTEVFGGGRQKSQEPHTSSTNNGIFIQKVFPSSKPSKAPEEPQGDTGVSDLVGVANIEDYRGDPDEEKPASEEARLMEGIFARSGVHSALEHDQIINGKRKIAGDRHILEREAKKIAEEAAAALRRAGEAARTIQPGTVTWTGEVGSAGRPNIMRRGGPSSAGILAGLSNRQGLMNGGASTSASSSRSGTPGATSTPRGRALMESIRDFIKRHGGSAASQSLVDHFRRQCRGDQQNAEFKAMLYQIADLQKSGNNSRMRGHWVLKDEYR